MSLFIDLLQTSNDFRCLKPSNKSEIVKAENELQLKFSDEYKEYVLTCGAAIGRGHEFTGLTTSKRLNVVSVTQEERQYHTVPSDWYVVEQLYIDGVVIWQSTNGEVFQSLPGQSPTKLCNSLLEYIKL